MKRTMLCLTAFSAFLQTLQAIPPGALEKKFPKAKADITFIEAFPVLAQLLVADAPWKLPPANTSMEPIRFNTLITTCRKTMWISGAYANALAGEKGPKRTTHYLIERPPEFQW